MARRMFSARREVVYGLEDEVAEGEVLEGGRVEAGFGGRGASARRPRVDEAGTCPWDLPSPSRCPPAGAGFRSSIGLSPSRPFAVPSTSGYRDEGRSRLPLRPPGDGHPGRPGRQERRHGRGRPLPPCSIRRPPGRRCRPNRCRQKGAGYVQAVLGAAGPELQPENLRNTAGRPAFMPSPEGNGRSP
jgi:hypothetical protein